MEFNSERLLNRFLGYVKIDTGSDDHSGKSPSSPNQLVLGQKLVDELKQIGLQDVELSEFGVVYATIPAIPRDRLDPSKLPVIGFSSHMDTASDVPTGPVKPQVIRDYAGGDIPLPGDPAKAITVAQNPELEGLKGTTIITSDGTTLLGADDKAGLAVIVEMAAVLMEHPEITHGTIRLCLTPDEEIGQGTDHIDLKKFACDFAYTLDGSGVDLIEAETFSADSVMVYFTGRNVHPGDAKGKMINSIRAAGDFVRRLPFVGMAPETTEGREGFIHPTDIHGTVEAASLRLILRSFDTKELDVDHVLLETLAEQTKQAFPGWEVRLEFKKQYRNMAEGLKKDPRSVKRAEEALKRCGRTPKYQVVRGGTDGSQLTEMGVPTPNLATGQHAIHSYMEWASLDEMLKTLQWVIEIVRVIEYV